MPPHPALPRLAAAAVLALLAGTAPTVAAPTIAAPTAAASAAASPSRSPAVDAGQGQAELAVARERSARAAAAVDEIKRELAPGHLTDPMPETDRAFGLASLRSDYADAQRRAAGYRATLGDQHPTLRATEQTMDDLRAQILAGTRRALASAERDAAEARAEVGAAERRLAAATASGAAPVGETAPGRTAAAAADVTGSVAAPARRSASPLSLPPAAAAVERPAPAEAGPSPASRHPLRGLILGAAAASLATLLAAWAALRALRSLLPRRPRAAPRRVDRPVGRRIERVEPAMAAVPVPAVAEPASRAAEPAAAELAIAAVAAAPATVPATVPVLGRLSGTDDAARGDAMAGLHATLRAAFGDAAARMTVLVAPAAGLSAPDADAAAFALAAAAAAAGYRPLLMEARALGRLRGALAPAGAMPTAIEAGGAVRTLYRVGPGGAVALLPSDPGEAEAAALAAALAEARPGAPILRGLAAFDTVVLVGDAAAALAGSADLVLLAAPAEAPAAALDAAAGPLRPAGRPCGAVLVAPSARAMASAQVADAPARPAPPPRGWIGAQPTPTLGANAPAPSRRLSPQSSPLPAPLPSPLGLRGSLDPVFRRAG